MVQPAGVRACLSCVPAGTCRARRPDACTGSRSFSWTAFTHVRADRRRSRALLRGRQRQAGSRRAGFISALRRRLGAVPVRAMLAGAQVSSPLNTASLLGLALPHCAFECVTGNLRTAPPPWRMVGGWTWCPVQKSMARSRAGRGFWEREEHECLDCRTFILSSTLSNV